jgi:hypothetical protein
MSRSCRRDFHSDGHYADDSPYRHRGVSTPKAPNAAAAAVEVRSTVGPSRAVCRSGPRFDSDQTRQDLFEWLVWADFDLQRRLRANASSVQSVFERGQLHKIRNVKDYLPQRLRSSVGRKMTDAYHAGSALEAEAALLALAKELDRTHPGGR